MEVAAFCAGSRVWIVAGKGGVGKTTIAGALADLAAGAGLSVLVVELEGAPGLPAAFGHRQPLGYEPSILQRAPGDTDGATRAAAYGHGHREAAENSEDDGRLAPGSVWGRRLTPDDALVEYLSDHGLHRVSRRLVATGVVEVVATAIPGVKDVLVLGKVKQLERAGVADVIVVDAPATGHAMTFLSSAGGLLDAARGGPLRTQATEVVELLQDPRRCRVVLVTLPEEMPTNETIEAAYLLEDRAGVKLGPVVVNCVDRPPASLSSPPPDAGGATRTEHTQLSPRQRQALGAARQFRLERAQLADDQLRRLAHELPLPQLYAPLLAAPAIGPEERRSLSAALADGVRTLTAEGDEAGNRPVAGGEHDRAADAGGAG